MPQPNILGALSDPQFYGDVKQRLVDALRGGVQDVFPTGAGPHVASAFGIPADPEYAQKLQNLALGALTVYHGSPHKFDAFDMSKIGTGEGAQAYGHGLYVAESPAVAKGYAIREAAARGPNVSSYGSTKGSILSNAELNSIAGEFNAAMNLPEKYITASNRPMTGNDVMNVTNEVTKAMRTGKYTNPYTEGSSENKLFNYLSEKNKSNEYLYKADIPDEAVARMLDWDRPLSQQSDAVKSAVSKRIGALKSHQFPNGEFAYTKNGLSFVPIGKAATFDEAIQNLSGKDIYNLFTDASKINKDQIASETLKQAGIPGIRYSDAMSRGMQGGTSNYVLFDDQLARILERNQQTTGQAPWLPGEWKPQVAIPSQQAAAQLKQALTGQ